jgi:probable phosphoglycerate mutase
MRFLRVFTVTLVALLALSGPTVSQAAPTHTYIYLVRHGQSVDNANGLQSGWSSTPLTALGERQATAMGKKLKTVVFGSAYSSGSVRAVKTLDAILAVRATPMVGQVDPRFREWGVGSFDQKPVSVLQAAQAKKLKTSVADLWKFTDTAKFDAIAAVDPAKQAEKWSTFRNRILAGAGAVAKKGAGSNVIVVSHGYVIKHLIKQLTGKWATGSISNTSVTVLDFTGGKWVLVQQPTLTPKVPAVLSGQ